MAETKTKFETDRPLHGNKKNKNKFCKGCKHIKTCYKGKAAMIINCLDYAK